MIRTTKAVHGASKVVDHEEQRKRPLTRDFRFIKEYFRTIFKKINIIMTLRGKGFRY